MNTSTTPSADDIVAGLGYVKIDATVTTQGVSADEKRDLLAERDKVAAELAAVRGTDGHSDSLQILPIGELSPYTDWQLCTSTPAHDGEYEVIHPITGIIFRAEYDTMFEAWSCDYQYPTWRGLREQS